MGRKTKHLHYITMIFFLSSYLPRSYLPTYKRILLTQILQKDPTTMDARSYIELRSPQRVLLNWLTTTEKIKKVNSLVILFYIPAYSIWNNYLSRQPTSQGCKYLSPQQYLSYAAINYSDYTSLIYISYYLSAY